MTGFVFGAGGGTDISDTTLLQNEALPGKYFYLADGTKVEGTMATKGAATLMPSSSADTVVSAGQYLTGAQTLPMDADFVAENIKNGVNLWGVTGNFTSDANATANKILSGYSAYVNGVKLTGTYSALTFWYVSNVVTPSSGYITLTSASLTNYLNWRGVVFTLYGNDESCSNDDVLGGQLFKTSNLAINDNIRSIIAYDASSADWGSFSTAAKIYDITSNSITLAPGSGFQFSSYAYTITVCGAG